MTNFAKTVASSSFLNSDDLYFNFALISLVSESSGIVRPSSRLDYETLVDKFYILNISASDGGFPQFTSYTGLNISVTDFNDNQPKFSQRSYNLHVFENQTVDVYFDKITSSDADSGVNAKVMI